MQERHGEVTTSGSLLTLDMASFLMGQNYSVGGALDISTGKSYSTPLSFPSHGLALLYT